MIRGLNVARSSMFMMLYDLHWREVHDLYTGHRPSSRIARQRLCLVRSYHGFQFQALLQIGFQLALDPSVHRVRRVVAVAVGCSGRFAGEDFDTFFNCADLPDPELTGLDGIDDTFLEHQVFYVGGRNHHALAAVQPLALAHVEETLDLLVDSADGLDLPLLVDRSGDGDALTDGQLRQAGEDRVQFGGGSTVAVDTAVALLEGEADGQAQGVTLGKGAAQITRENQDAFVVALARELGFPFDVDDAGTAHEGLGGDARWPAKGDLADLIDRQGVDLAHGFTGHVDHDGAVHVILVDFFFVEVVAKAVFAEGGENMGLGDAVGAFLAGPVIGLLDHAGDGAEAQGEFAFAINGLFAILHHGGNTPRRKGQKPAIPAHPGDEVRVEPFAFVGAGHLIVEVRAYAEDLVELGIVVLQHLKRLVAAQKDHLDVQGNRCRPQGRGPHAHVLGHVLDAEHFVLQGPLEGFPHLGMIQNRLHLQDEETPVGLQQGAGLDHGEVGDQSSHEGLFVDAAEDVGIGGIGLEDHRRAGQSRAVLEDVDLVAGQGELGSVGGSLVFRVGIRRPRQEKGDILDHVRLNFIEKGEDLRLIGVILTDQVHAVLDHEQTQLAG
ncbi:hypothetical protein DESC_370143 [Desulfosarcina cetonica]|nr:hypothetical protein DESC_370143 [Desulfosarcina cetonica]